MSARSLVLVIAFAFTCEADIPFRDPVYRETALRHTRPRASGEKFDSKESDPKLRETFAAADAAAERRVANVRRDEKFIFHFWSTKKDILRRQYGIDWKTPAELNPQIAYTSYGQPQITQRESRTSNPIVFLDRDYQGKVRAWTKPGTGEESIAYVVRFERRRWKIVDVERWLQ